MRSFTIATRIASSLLSCVLLTLAGTAAAQVAPEDEQARNHFVAGRQYYDSGAYEDAEREFRRSYELSHRPELLMNLYTVNERLGRLTQAVDYLERYLAEGNPENRAQLEERLVRLRERAASDGGGGSPPAQAGSDDGLLIAGAVVLGVGGLGLLSFAGFAGATAAHYGSFSDSCSPGCDAGAISDGNTYALAADVSLGVGLGVAAAGAVMLIVALVSGGSDDRVALAPFAGPNTVGLALAGDLP